MWKTRGRYSVGLPSTGSKTANYIPNFLHPQSLARAILPKQIFTTYELNLPPGTNDSVNFEIDLNALLTVLDIFGAVGSIPSSLGGATGGRGRGRGKWAANGEDGEFVNPNGGAGIERFLVGNDKGSKLTGMRMIYEGEGFPISLTLCGKYSFLPITVETLTNLTGYSSEDATGPTTTCKLNTMESDPYMELDFNDDDK